MTCAAAALTDTSCAKELLRRHCCALGAKENTALVEQAETISSGRCVDLSRTYVGAAGLQAMTALLARNTHLVELRLRENGLSNEAVVMLCRALKTQPACDTLRLLDLSDNTALSLAAGLEVLSLVQHCPTLAEVYLERTALPVALRRKIAQAATMNATRPTPPPARAVAHASRQRRAGVRQAAWDAREHELLRQLRVQHLAPSAEADNCLGAGVLPMPTVTSGWRVLGIAVLAPPRLFAAEKECLLQNVFPRLNAALRSHRIQLMPLIDTHVDCPTPLSRPDDVHFTSACDLVADVRRSPFVVLELIGDRAGDYEQPPASVMFAYAAQTSTGSDVAATVPLKPVLYTAHAEALRCCRWLLLAQRKPASQLVIPPSLAPLLSDAPSMAHPDPHRAQHRRRLVVSRVQTACCLALRVAQPPSVQELIFDRGVEEAQWRRHEAFCTHALATAPAEQLVLRHYHAVFDSVDSHGRLLLRELDEFAEAIYCRLSLLLQHAVAQEDGLVCGLDETGRHETEALSRSARQQLLCHAYLTQCAARLGGGVVADALCKGPLSRLQAYAAAAPPQRRHAPLLLLHCERDAWLSRQLLARCALRWRAMPHLGKVAIHLATARAVREEPTDGRDVVIDLVQQLSADVHVRHYVQHEVDQIRLWRFFARLLVAGDGVAVDEASHPIATRDAPSPAPQQWLILLDGLDEIDAPVQPCAALRIDDDDGATIPPAVTSTTTAHSTTPCAQQRSIGSEGGVPSIGSLSIVNLLPIEWAATVRLVVSCRSSSKTLFKSLAARGREAVELVAIEPDAVRSCALASLAPAQIAAETGICVSEADCEVARGKQDAALVEYQRYLVAAMRAVVESPGYVRGMREMLQVYPATLPEAARAVRDAAVAAVGRPVLYRMIGVLRCARWGLLEMELAELLPLSRGAFNALMRLLRPVVETNEDPPASAPDTHPGQMNTTALRQMMRGNALFAHVRLCSPAFVDALHEEHDVDVEAADTTVWHDVLAEYYTAVVRRVLAAESTPPLFAPVATDVLEYVAVKELPYHLIHAARWALLDELVLSPAYLQLVYRNELAYHHHRDLVAGFNIRHERYVLGHDEGCGIDTSGTTWQTRSDTDAALPTALQRMREYIRFVRTYSAKLARLPPPVSAADAARGVLQAAVELPVQRHGDVVRSEAVRYLRQFYTPQDVGEATSGRVVEQVYMIVASAHDASLALDRVHLGEVRSMAFSDNGRCLVTGGADRRLCWFEPAVQQGGAHVVRQRQCGGGVEKVVWCATSCYVAVLMRDRSIAVYDGAHDTLVSTLNGAALEAPVAAFAFSARGRYYLVACDDLTVRLVETERGRVLRTLRTSDLLPPTAAVHAQRNHIVVLTDRSAEDVFYVVVNAQLQRWRVQDGIEPDTVMQSAVTLPCGPVRQVRWCSPAFAPDRTVGEAPNAAYLLLQPLHQCHRLVVYDALRHVDVFYLPTRLITNNATCPLGSNTHPAAVSHDETYSMFAVSHSGERVACTVTAGPHAGQIMLYTLPWHEVIPTSQSCPSLVPSHVLLGLMTNASAELDFRWDGGALFAFESRSHRLLFWDLARGSPRAQYGGEGEWVMMATTGEYTSEPLCTSWAVARGGEVDDPGRVEVAMGHASGAVTLLRLWCPSRA